MLQVSFLYIVFQVRFILFKLMIFLKGFSSS